MRNTEPDTESVKSHFSGRLLPTESIKRIVNESIDAGFYGTVCLSHYNEPLMDGRIIEIARWIASRGLRTVACSNADMLSESLAKALDGVFKKLSLSFYMDEPVKSQRIEWCKGLFKRCEIEILDGSHIIATHGARGFDLVQLSQSFGSRPCFEPDKRMVVNHTGKIMLCCSDMIGRFGVGSIYEDLTMAELWNHPSRRMYTEALKSSGGRSVHPHCLACPRP
jgi:hypothetical protein